MSFMRAIRRGLRSASAPPQLERELVAICVPCGRGTMPPQLSEMLIQAIELNADPRCPFYFARLVMEASWRIDRMRNHFSAECVKNAVGRMFMVDDDMNPPRNWLDLLAIDADIVSGSYLMHKRLDNGTLRLSSATDFSYDEKQRKLQVNNAEAAVLERDAVGTGCIVIRRRVLEDPRMVLPTKYVNWLGDERDLADEPNEPPPLFQMHYKPNGTLDHGEDMDFCLRAKALGYTVKVDGRNKWGHRKLLDLQAVEDYGLRIADERTKTKISA